MVNQNIRLVIYGGISCGATAAIKARHLSQEAQIILLDPSDYVSFDKCSLPYHLEGSWPDIEVQYQNAFDHMRRVERIDVRTQNRVIQLQRESKRLIVHDDLQDLDYELAYDRLILSPAALPIIPMVEGIGSKKVCSLGQPGDIREILHLLDTLQPKRVAVLGAGYMGLAITDTLTKRGLKISLIDKDRQVMAGVDAEMALPLHHHLLAHQVDVHLNDTITAIQESPVGLDLHLYSGATLSCGVLILAAGIQPNVDLASEAGLKIGPHGGVIVNPHMQTSDPSIYAIGDVIEVTDYVGGFETLTPLAGPAHQQSRIAAANVMGQDEVYQNIQGTAIGKVFDQAVGITGLNEKDLTREQIPFEKIYVHPTCHADTYPGATALTLKLLFSPDDGTLFGAQCVGSEGVDKRLDVLATALRAGMTVFDLEALELAYAPPFGTPSDAINIAGAVAADVLRGEMPICHVVDIVHPQPHQVLLDIRRAEERQDGLIPAALHIPLEELPQRIQDLPTDKELLIISQTDAAARTAACLLKQRNWVCRCLSGGYQTYQQTLQAGLITNVVASPVSGGLH